MSDYKIASTKKFIPYYEGIRLLQEKTAKRVIRPGNDIFDKLRLPNPLIMLYKEDYFILNQVTHYQLVHENFFGVELERNVPEILYERDIFKGYGKMVNPLRPKGQNGVSDSDLILVSWRAEGRERDKHAPFVYNTVYKRRNRGFEIVEKQLPKDSEFEPDRFIDPFMDLVNN